MSGKLRHCDPLFKRNHKSHIHCHKSKRPCYFSGEKLNVFLKNDVMEKGKQYRVCANIGEAIKCVRVPRKKAEICYPVDTVTFSRDERIHQRRRQQSTFDIKKVKRVIVSVKDGGDDEVIQYKRISAKGNYHNAIINSASYYKPFVKLTMLERRRRMQSIAKEVLACCVDKKLFINNPNLYLKGNKELANEIADFLDGVKESIEDQLDINFVHLENEAVPLEKNSTNENEEGNDSISTTAQNYRAAITILSDCTKKGYNRILSDLKVQFDLPSLPSFYVLTKNRPKMCEMNIDPLMQLGTGIKKKPLVSDESTNGYTIDEETALMSTGDGGEIITGGKIVGGYPCYVEMMASKHRKYNRNIPENADVIVIDSFDGAEHAKSNKKRTSLITFSSQLFTPEMINLGEITCGSSLNILTWQQLNGTESYSNMMPAVKDYF